MSDKKGLAFVGGGGKGAYQTGVWEALHTTGLDKEISAVAGTSVGGLNAAMFVQGDFNKAKSVWESISPFKVLRADAGIKSAFSNENLSKLIDKSVDMDSFDDPNMKCWITAHKKLNVQQQYSTPGNNGETKMLVDGNAHYFNMSCFSPEDRKKILLASAALPAVFESVEIDNVSYRDGGLSDNVPVKPLCEEEKCSIIIVVHLNQNPGRSDSSIDRDNYKGTTFIEIWPSKYQGNTFTGTLNFLSSSAQKRMALGYKDAIELFRDIVEIRRQAGTSEKKVECFEKLIEKKIKLNGNISEHIDSFTKGWNTEQLIQLSSECKSLLIESSNRALQVKELKTSNIQKLTKEIVKNNKQIINNQYQLNRVFSQINQLLLDRIDVLQHETAALAAWSLEQDEAIRFINKKIIELESRVDLHEYQINCGSYMTGDGIKYTELPEARRILQIVFDMAQITQGNIFLEPYHFDKVRKEAELPETIRTEDFYDALYSNPEALPLFIRSKWDYKNSSLSSYGRKLYAIKKISDFKSDGINAEISFTDTEEIRTAELCYNLYKDTINLAYSYQQKQAAIQILEAEANILGTETSGESLIKEKAVQLPLLVQNTEFAKQTYRTIYHTRRAIPDELINIEPNYITISDSCIEHIKWLCKQANFCRPDDDIASMLGVDMDDVFLCHNDTRESKKRGFAITSDGIYSVIDEKRGKKFIPFDKLANAVKFHKHKHKNPMNQHKFIEAEGIEERSSPVLPYQMIDGGSAVIIPFLEAIRNTCWTDLHL